MKLQKTLFNVFMLLLLTASSVSAQTTVTVGTATGTSSKFNASPINISWESNICQTIYTAAELQAAGFIAGNIIQQIGWDVVQSPAHALPNFTIKMGHTALTAFSTSIRGIDPATLTQVYNIASYQPSSGGFNMLALDNSFTWNGTDNLVISSCFDVATYSLSGTVSIFSSVSTSFAYARSQNSPQCGVTPNGIGYDKPVVRFSIAAPLPVELTYFQGKANDNQIQLNWETASELNNSGFEIHKSNNGKDWETIDFIEGQGTTIEVSNYQYEDQNPLIGTNYYRLKQVDFDGAFEYSKTIAVEYNIEESNITIFPNPSNGVVNLQINNPSNQKMQIKILDNLGRIIRDSEIIEGEANWQQEMVIKEKGIYTVAIQIGNEIIYKRIVIAD